MMRTLLVLMAAVIGMMASEQADGRWYMALKGTHISGGEKEELKGKGGFGSGIELGYEFAEHFALEGMYVQASTDEATSDEETATGDYTTYGVNAAYIQHITHHMMLVGKVGYVNEHEEIHLAHAHKADETGFDFGVGVEYEVNPSFEVLAEYEHESIEGTRGDDFFLGAKYIFATH